MWVLIATQDPTSVPKQVTSLSTLTIVHRIGDRDMLKEMQKRVAAWEGVTIDQLQALGQGEVYAVATRATDQKWTQKPMKLRIRPPCSQPGGGTRTAVS